MRISIATAALIGLAPMAAIAHDVTAPAPQATASAELAPLAPSCPPVDPAVHELQRQGYSNIVIRLNSTRALVDAVAQSGATEQFSLMCRSSGEGVLLRAARPSQRITPLSQRAARPSWFDRNHLLGRLRTGAREDGGLSADAGNEGSTEYSGENRGTGDRDRSTGDTGGTGGTGVHTSGVSGSTDGSDSIKPTGDITTDGRNSSGGNADTDRHDGHDDASGTGGSTDSGRVIGESTGGSANSSETGHTNGTGNAEAGSTGGNGSKTDTDIVSGGGTDHIGNNTDTDNTNSNGGKKNREHDENGHGNDVDSFDESNPSGKGGRRN